jgi:ribulose-bisphosphate carboxylase large chain
MSIDIVRDNKDLAKYFYVTYDVESTKSVYDAAWNIAVGQSIGNPNQRSVWETDEMIETHSAKIMRNTNFEKKKGRVVLAFPNANIDWDTDGIAQLLCIVQGGQVDIDSIKKCRVMDIEIHPQIIDTHFKKPRYGITGIRDFTNTHGKPLFGGIVKPKTGVTPQVLLEMTKQLVEGGVNFIKEDEILSNPAVCRLQDRVELISNYIQGKDVVYCFCINSDPAHIVDRARFVAQNGGNGVHVNIWSGLGSYRSIREADLGLFIHYQKSGDKVITGKNNPFGIEWTVLCKLAAICGVDTIHAGMWGGYLSDDETELRKTLDILHERNVLPALSCGMHPGIVNATSDKFGVDFLANVGGAIHGHPGGTLAGAKAMRQAIDKTPGPEFKVAIDQWGYETNGQSMPEWVLDF